MGQVSRDRLKKISAVGYLRISYSSQKTKIRLRLVHFHLLLLTRCYFSRKIEILVLTSLISAIPGRQVRACCFLFLEEDRHKLVVLAVRKEATLKDGNMFLKKFTLCYVGAT